MQLQIVLKSSSLQFEKLQIWKTFHSIHRLLNTTWNKSYRTRKGTLIWMSLSNRNLEGVTEVSSVDLSCPLKQPQAILPPITQGLDQIRILLKATHRVCTYEVVSGQIITFSQFGLDSALILGGLCRFLVWRYQPTDDIQQLLTGHLTIQRIQTSHWAKQSGPLWLVVFENNSYIYPSLCI